MQVVSTQGQGMQRASPLAPAGCIKLHSGNYHTFAFLFILNWIDLHVTLRVEAKALNWWTSKRLTLKYH